MALTACPQCGGTSFTGSVTVAFFNVDIELTDDGFRTADWMDAPASEDEITSATCSSCGREQVRPEAG